MKVLYESGWQTVKINYYKDHIQKYYVAYNHNTEDNIGENDIDMVEVYVVELAIIQYIKVSFS